MPEIIILFVITQFHNGTHTNLCLTIAILLENQKKEEDKHSE